MNWSKEIKEKEKNKIRNKVCGLKNHKTKKQKVLKVITPPQWQRYRYAKESRSTGGGIVFGDVRKGF
jgi:hypothetical protein